MKKETTESHYSEERPWGSFTILDEGENYKVMRLEVLPGKRLSYQRHAHRAEHWFVVRGTAKVTLNDAEILVRTGEALDVLCSLLDVDRILKWSRVLAGI